MSSNPFGDVPPNPYEAGPYAPPGSHGYGMQPPDKEYAKSRLQIPAIVLMTLASLTAIARVGFIVMLLQQAGAQNGAQPFTLPMIAGHGIPLLLLIAVIAGCFQMLRLDSYSAARSAAIISLIPFCSPGIVLGIPFGIWALVALYDPRVKQAFR